MTAVERNLASLEQALSLEIQRRIDLESRIASQVEAGLRKAARSATGVVEEQLATAQRQHADEIRVRLLSLERSVGSLQHRLWQVEDREKPQGLQGDRQLAWLESRIAGLELQKPLEIPLEVSRQLQLIRNELIDEAAARWQDVAQLIRAEVDDTRQRVDALERWLREAMAPEVVRLQLDLASERRCREQLEKKVVNPTQRSPRVPPVNKPTWSFESILPRERKSLKAPEQGSQPVQVSKETSETLQNLDDLDGATAQKEFRTEQSTALSDLSATASASLERENEGDNHDDHILGAATAPRKSSIPIGPERDRGDRGIRGQTSQRDGPGGPEPPEPPEPGVSPRANPEATIVSDESKTTAASGQASAESAQSAAEVPRTQRAMLGRMRRSLKDR